MHRAIAAFADASGVETPTVVVELADSARFTVQRLEADPGFGMVTLHVVPEDDDSPDALVVPLGSIRRIELRKTAEERVRFGFTVERG